MGFSSKDISVGSLGADRIHRIEGRTHLPSDPIDRITLDDDAATHAWGGPKKFYFREAISQLWRVLAGRFADIKHLLVEQGRRRLWLVCPALVRLSGAKWKELTVGQR